MSMGLMVQYGVIALMLGYAVRSVWRRLKPSKGGGCENNGCGSCSGGCRPVQRILVHNLGASIDRDG